jgi:hypothetical protein
VARRASLRLSLGAVALLAAGSVVLQSASAGRSLAAFTGIAIAPGPTFTLLKWDPDTSNLMSVTGTVMANGSPVSGARVRVDNYDVPAPTDKAGKFVYRADATLLQRHVVTVTNVAAATVSGQALSAEEKDALLASEASINVAYAVADLKVSRNAAGQPVITGKLAKKDGTPPPAVGLLTYQLTGTVTGSDGKPVSGVQVSTRTIDRDYWSISTETDSAGRYESFFTASANEPGDPVPFAVRVSKGDNIFQLLSQEFVYFKRLKSARLNIELPPSGFAMAVPRPTSYPGAVYTGTLVGVTSGQSSVKPVSATWPDRQGRFSITLPKSLVGKQVSIWEGKTDLFSVAEAKPGGAVDLQDWPTNLPRQVPRGLATVRLK